MSKLSVIVPARNELFLNKTVDDLFAKAHGDVEVIAVLDGYWPGEQQLTCKKLLELPKKYQKVPMIGAYRLKAGTGRLNG